MLVACAGTAPLSGPRPGAATAPAVPPSVPARPSTAPAPIVPAPEGRATTSQQAAELAPQDKPLPQPAYQPTSDRIALLLPVQSPVYGRAAEAVRAGFLAAADAAGSASRTQVIGYGDDGVLLAVAEATASGAALVVGPLTRDDLKTVLAMAPAR